MAAPLYLPTSSARGFRLLHVLADTCYPSVTVAICGDEVLSRWDADLYFLITNDTEHLFTGLLTIFMSFMCVQTFCPFLNCFFLSFC